MPAVIPTGGGVSQRSVNGTQLFIQPGPAQLCKNSTPSKKAFRSAQVLLNSTFDDNSIWTLGSGVTIGSGVATAVGAIQVLGQAALTPGLTYVVHVDWTVSSGVDIRLNNSFSNGANIVHTWATGSGGTKIITFVATDPWLFIEASGAAFSGTIDNFTATELPTDLQVLRNSTFDVDDYWTKGSGVTISGGTANPTGASSILGQGTLTVGRAYNVSVDWNSTTGVNLRLSSAVASGIIGSPWATTGGTSGTQTASFTATTPWLWLEADGGLFTGTIDNFTATEITSIVGSSTLAFSQTAAASGSGSLVSDSPLTFSTIGSGTAAIFITATSALAFTTSGSETAKGTLAGSTQGLFTGASAESASGKLVGSSSLVFTPTGAETASISVSASSTVVFTPSGAETAKGTLVGSTQGLFNGTGGESSSGRLVGASSLLFSPTGAETARGGLTSSSSLTLSSTVNLSGFGTLAGSTQGLFTGSANESSVGSLVADSSLSFSSNSSLSSIVYLTSTTSVLFSSVGVLSGTGVLGGSGNLSFLFTGSFASFGGKAKLWDGLNWVEKNVKVWNGSSWTTKPVKVWNGSSWVLS
jgi:hypothetical protein